MIFFKIRQSVVVLNKNKFEMLKVVLDAASSRGCQPTVERQPNPSRKTANLTELIIKNTTK